MTSGHPEPLHLYVDAEPDGTPCVTVRGELSHTTAPILVEQLRTLPGDVADVVLDVSAVSFCDSSGLAAMISAHRRSSRRGGTVTLRGPHGPLRRILRLTGVDSLFAIEDACETGNEVAQLTGQFDTAAGGQA